MAKIDLVTTAIATTNRVKISIFREPDRVTALDIPPPQIYSAPHAQRTWVFHDIVRGADYFFRWTEIDSNDLDIRVIAFGNFTAEANTAQLRDGVSIIVGVTPNVVAGTNSALLDGSNGSPDFRGWEILPFLEGTRFLDKDLDYTWNSTTGLFSLLNGALFYDGVHYFIQFKPQLVGGGGSGSGSVVVRDAWTETLVITDDTTLTAPDLNKNILIKGNDGYLKITLPDIALVPANKLIYIESAAGFHKCAEIACSLAPGNADKIAWPTTNRSSIYMGQGESFAIYKEPTANVFRVKFPDGNFKTVGEFISEFADIDHVINKIALDGGQYDVLEYARLYKDYVLKLPTTAIVNFDVWTNNPQKFSYANADGKFRVPFTNTLYERGSGATATNPTNYTAGDYLPGTVGPHKHIIKYVMNGTDGQPNGQQLDPSPSPVENNPKGTNNYAIENNEGTETRPNSIVVNKYIRC